MLGDSLNCKPLQAPYVRHHWRLWVVGCSAAKIPVQVPQLLPLDPETLRTVTSLAFEQRFLNLLLLLRPQQFLRYKGQVSYHILPTSPK